MKGQRSHVESALEWQLKLVTWEFFATLTWHPDRLGSVRSRRRNVMRWLETVSKWFQLTPSDLSFVIRWERGELGGNPHAHLLLARFPSAAISLTTCFAMRSAWKAGISQVRLYEPARNAEAYMTKGQFSAAWAQGANTYELRKFDNADAVYISLAAQLEMEQSRTSGRRMLPVLR